MKTSSWPWPRWGAFCTGFFGQGEYPEAVFVMLFYQVGELFQDYAVGKSRQSISALMDIRPDYANLEQDGGLLPGGPGGGVGGGRHHRQGRGKKTHWTAWCWRAPLW